MKICKRLVLPGMLVSLFVSTGVLAAKTNHDEPVALEYQEIDNFDLHKEKKKWKKKKKKISRKERLEARRLAEEKRKKKIMVCNYLLSDISDKRQNKETIGARFSYPLVVNGVEQWLDKAQQDFNKKALQEEIKAAKSITLRPSLTRLYSYAESMNLHGVSALSVDFLEGERLIETRKYRGNGAVVNWANGVSEYHDVVNLSLHYALSAVKKDLSSVCQGASKS